MASEYGNLGNTAFDRGDLDDAETLYGEALEINEALGRKESMAINYGNLGILASKRGNWDEAETLYRQALEIDEALGSKESMAIWASLPKSAVSWTK